MRLKVPDDADLPRRKFMRLKRADYSAPGAYYVTICAHDKACIFGCITKGQMRLNNCGSIAQAVWHRIPSRSPLVETDAWVVMPNHVHGIVKIKGQDEANYGQTGGQEIAQRPSLGKIVAGYKSEVSRRINQLRCRRGAPVWQRNYYEHIIRDEDELAHARRYIEQNPEQWSNDRHNPFSSVAADQLTNAWEQR